MGNQYAKDWKKLKMPPITNQEYINHQPVLLNHDVFLIFRPDKKFIWLYAYMISKNKWVETLKLAQDIEIEGLTLAFNPDSNTLYVFKKQSKEAQNGHKMLLFDCAINNDFYGDTAVSDECKLINLKLVKEVDIGQESKGGRGEAMNSILINDEIHVIDRLKHWIFDTNEHKTSHFGEFGSSTPAPARLIYDTYSDRERLLKFSSRIGHFDDESKEWRQLRYKIPNIPGIRYYGCVLCRNGRYVLLLGGQHWRIIGNKWQDSCDIFVFDINEEAFHKTLGCPVTGGLVYATYVNTKANTLILGMANESEDWLDDQILPDTVVQLIWKMCGKNDYEYVHIFANNENKAMEHWRIELNKLLTFGRKESQRFLVGM